MKIRILLAFFTLLSIHVHAEEVYQDDRYVVTRKNWSEITIDCQRELMSYFENKFSQFLHEIHVPSFWNNQAKRGLLGTQKQFSKVTTQTNTHASDFATTHQIDLKSLLPTGFILGLGVSGSANFIAGLEGSALLTIIVVPFEIETYDNVTGQTTKHYEASWALGGIGQQAAGGGVGGGLVVRGAIGLIWGDLPDASALTGLAIGASVNVAAFQGLGFKAAIVFNSSTQQDNLVAMATYDMGAEVNATTQVAMYYFMNAQQIVNYVSGTQLNNITGTETFQLPSIKQQGA